MAEIEDAAQAALALVALHHIGLEFAAAADHGHDRRRFEALYGRPLTFEKSEEVAVDGGTILDHLAHAAAELRLGQGAEHVRVDEHGPRLVKGADQVLALVQVHAGLAAHRTVHLGEQRGRYLHKRNTAQVDRGEKPGHVADHAAAQGKHSVAAIKAALGEFAGQCADGGQVLARLAVSKGDQLTVDARRTERIHQPPAVERPDHIVRDDRPAPTDPRLGKRRTHRVEHTAADDNRITPLPQADLDRFRSHIRNSLR